MITVETVSEINGYRIENVYLDGVLIGTNETWVGNDEPQN